jgi:hypothetical protein
LGDEISWAKMLDNPTKPLLLPLLPGHLTFAPVGDWNGGAEFIFHSPTKEALFAATPSSRTNATICNWIMGFNFNQRRKNYLKIAVSI